MQHTFRQIFRSGKFIIGFTILMMILLMVIIYPLLFPYPPLQIIAQGTFFPPGVYVSVYDAINAPALYTLNLEDADLKRIANRLSQEDREAMKEWLVSFGVPEEEIDIENTEQLLSQWNANYDPNLRLPGMTFARQRYFQRVNAAIDGLLSTEGAIVATRDPETGTLEEKTVIQQTDYANVDQIANVRVLPLGTDNFGRDVLPQLVVATRVSLLIGLVAGLIATTIGLSLGLVAGYIGGLIDDVIMFVTNLFTVIPAFVLLILISFSIGQDRRGAITIAIVIGFTSWVWTARAVRSQVLSLRNRDHVNLSKLSGHSVFRIILIDILPYIASYVVMALILQISSGILAEAGLSILGLGPRTTETPTLGLMLNWSMIYQAHILGKWWAYLPVLITIALISFSMNLMNTGLDQVFNPALRD
ncbi:ABC transporter permease [Litorilinea aerophila]|uniref:ABC transporter permease n=1 Tax=Litorilinea aerophila TaxID=1204385 RepID=A0A540VGF3_9CHLR|nr:ABC transporter permease [Litorilinea aerophila]MCC9076516.1 ABC transporter permease [Litorilinea aerophila]OUC05928.1 ABC transporter permease [Litorilinea aerophila]GIV79574.1 MAG: ABC transporter permease [Litorilinea sp.]